MKFMTRRRGEAYEDLGDNDPLTGLANLFDLGLVFIVGLLISLFGAYHLQELFDRHSELTITKKSSDGRMEVISKKGKEIKVLKVSREKAKGKGQRLGTAYRLEDGTFVYIPD